MPQTGRAPHCEAAIRRVGVSMLRKGGGLPPALARQQVSEVNSLMIMKTTKQTHRCGRFRTQAALALSAACCGVLMAQQPTTPPSRPIDNPPVNDRSGTDTGLNRSTTGTLDAARDHTSGSKITVAPTKANKASSLIGMEVRGSDGKKLGEIEDIVFDLKSDRVAYAVLDVGGGGLFTADKHHAVPLRAFQAGPDGDYLTLSADRAKLERAPALQKDAWPSVVNPAWGAEPFWKDDMIDRTGDLNRPGVRGNDDKLHDRSLDGTRTIPDRDPVRDSTRPAGERSPNP